MSEIKKGDTVYYPFEVQEIGRGWLRFKGGRECRAEEVQTADEISAERVEVFGTRIMNAMSMQDLHRSQAEVLADCIITVKQELARTKEAKQ